jgi:hypothetical protein
VESSCECSNEPSGSIKCWELPSDCTTCGLSSGTQLHRVSWPSVGRFLAVPRDRLRDANRLRGFREAAPVGLATEDTANCHTAQIRYSPNSAARQL